MHTLTFKHTVEMRTTSCIPPKDLLAGSYIVVPAQSICILSMSSVYLLVTCLPSANPVSPLPAVPSPAPVSHQPCSSMLDLHSVQPRLPPAQSNPPPAQFHIFPSRPLCPPLLQLILFNSNLLVSLLLSSPFAWLKAKDLILSPKIFFIFGGAYVILLQMCI